MTATNVRDVNTADFATAVVERSHQVPVVVDFWAAWCGPCRVLGPLLERLAEEAGGAWELAKVDVDRNQELAMQFGIQGIPAVIGFRNGAPVARFTGAVPEAQVRAFLDQVLPSELDLRAKAGAEALAAGDAAGAEASWREVLSEDPGHEAAGVGLAELLLDRGEAAEALAVLDRLPPSERVRQLQAAARLADAGDLEELEARALNGRPEDRVAFGKALAGSGQADQALEVLTEIVAEGHGDPSEEARQAVVDLFDVLGPEHPLTVEYRKKLAAALF